MADIVNLTQRPVRLTVQPATQLPQAALDVSAYDTADLQLQAYELAGGGTATVELQTSMQNETEDGWELVAQWTNVTGVPFFNKVHFDNLLRYIRWRVTWTGGTTAFTFYITGMLRRN